MHCTDKHFIITKKCVKNNLLLITIKYNYLQFILVLRLYFDTFNSKEFTADVLKILIVHIILHLTITFSHS